LIRTFFAEQSTRTRLQYGNLLRRESLFSQLHHDPLRPLLTERRVLLCDSSPVCMPYHTDLDLIPYELGGGKERLE
jgi:hypothetical protein